MSNILTCRARIVGTLDAGQYAALHANVANTVLPGHLCDSIVTGHDVEGIDLDAEFVVRDGETFETITAWLEQRKNTLANVVADAGLKIAWRGTTIRGGH